MVGPVVPGASVPGEAGHFAPSFTHRVRSAICVSVSFPLGGICKPASSYRIAVTSRLFSTSPGSSEGPESPPAVSAASESTRNPPFCFSAP